MDNFVSNYAQVAISAKKEEKESFDIHPSSKYLINQTFPNYDSFGPKLTLIIYFPLHVIYKQKNNKKM